jgi:hypothetical protein
MQRFWIARACYPEKWARAAAPAGICYRAAHLSRTAVAGGPSSVQGLTVADRPPESWPPRGRFGLSLHASSASVQSGSRGICLPAVWIRR